MQLVAFIIGLLIVTMAVWGTVRPQALTMVAERWQGRTRLWIAVLARLGVGMILVFVAPSCRWPGFIEVVGYITIIAALGLLLMGSHRLDALVRWWAGKPAGFIRAWLLPMAAFGALLVYAPGW